MLTPKDAERFWSKVRIAGPDDCWPWTAASAKHRGGYGFFRVRGRTLYAHRLAYEMGSGEALVGGLVCHRCDSSSCCNPKHLYLGDHASNGADAARHGLIGRWDRRGDRNPAAKLSREDVIMVREEIAEGRTDTEIARRHGVTATAIRHIRSGHNWGWLTSAGQEVERDAG